MRGFLGSAIPRAAPTLIDLATSGARPSMGLSVARVGMGFNDCPAQSEEWEVEGTALPAMPTGASKYMNDGAGTGLVYTSSSGKLDYCRVPVIILTINSKARVQVLGRSYSVPSSVAPAALLGF